MVPSDSSALSRILSAEEGMTFPRTFRTLLVASIAPSTSPRTSINAAMNRLPKLWPDRFPDPPKRWANSFSIRPSLSARATRQLRRSPGAMISRSCRIRPDDPPSSATVTTAVRLYVFVFNPRSMTERPVPPPMTTTLGPLDNFILDKMSSLRFSDSFGMITPSMVRISRRVDHPMIRMPARRMTIPREARTV